MRKKLPLALALTAGAATIAMAAPQDTAAPAQPELPPEIAAQFAEAFGGKADRRREMKKFEDVAKDYKKVVSTADGQKSLYTIWTREKDAQVLLELPRNFDKQKIFLAYTIAGGIPLRMLWAGEICSK